MKYRKSKDSKALTFEEHLELGELLFKVEKLMTKQMLGLYVSSAGGKAINRYRTDLQQIRCFMDSQLSVDHPEHFDPAVYYSVSKRLQKVGEAIDRGDFVSRGGGRR